MAPWSHDPPKLKISVNANIGLFNKELPLSSVLKINKNMSVNRVFKRVMFPELEFFSFNLKKKEEDERRSLPRMQGTCSLL